MTNNIPKNTSYCKDKLVKYNTSWQKHLLKSQEKKTLEIKNLALYIIVIVTLVILGITAVIGGSILASCFLNTSVPLFLTGIIIATIGLTLIQGLCRMSPPSTIDIIPPDKTLLSKREIEESLSFYDKIKIDQNQESEKTSSPSFFIEHPSISVKDKSSNQ